MRGHKDGWHLTVLQFRSLWLTKESPFAFFLAAFLRLCEGGSEESELPTINLSITSWREGPRRWTPQSHRRSESTAEERATPVLPGENWELRARRR